MLEIWTQEVDEPGGKVQVHDVDNESSFEGDSYLSSIDDDFQLDLTTRLENMSVSALYDRNVEVHVGKVTDEAAMVRDGWRKLRHGITMDSGSNVDITPQDENPEFEIRELTGPRRGKRLAAANGTEIGVKGEKCIQMVTKEGRKLAWPFIAGSVKKTLKSVATTCDAGNNVLFTKHAAYIVNLESGDMLEVDRFGNDYTMEAWIRCKGQPTTSDGPASGFARLGATR